MCGFKARQKNIQGSVIQECMFSKSEIRHNGTEETKIVCAKGKGAFDNDTLIRGFKNFPSDCGLHPGIHSLTIIHN